MKTFTLTIVLVIAGLVAACRSKGPFAPDFFPPSHEVPGWVKSSDTRTFEASHLWEYIDGDAEKYIQAGVVRTLTSDYRYNDKVDATADIYVMAKPEGAKKLYDSEPSSGYKLIDAGEGGRIAKGSLILHQGVYFVRLVAYEDSPEIEQTLQDLVRAISSRLSKSGAGK